MAEKKNNSLTKTEDDEAKLLHFDVSSGLKSQNPIQTYNGEENSHGSEHQQVSHEGAMAGRCCVQGFLQVDEVGLPSSARRLQLTVDRSVQDQRGTGGPNYQKACRPTDPGSSQDTEDRRFGYPGHAILVFC